jgi:phosphatidylserine synthase
MRTAFSVLIGLVVTFVAVVLVTVVYYPHRTIPNHTTYLLLGGGVVLSAAILPLVHRVPTARLERADWIVRRVSSVLLASVVIGMVLLTRLLTLR